MPGPEILLAIAVLVLGVLPQQPTKQTTTASVNVLSTRWRIKNKMYKKHRRGAIMIRNKIEAKILKIWNRIWKTKENKGTPLIKHPACRVLVSNWNIRMLNRYTIIIAKGTQIQKVKPTNKQRVENTMIATGYSMRTPMTPTIKNRKI